MARGNTRALRHRRSSMPWQSFRRMMQLIHLAYKLMRPAPARPDQKDRLPDFLGTAHDFEMRLPHNFRRDRRRNSCNPQAPRGEALQQGAILNPADDVRAY